jgi:hypothetical protein
MKIPRSDYEQRRQAWHAALRQHGIDPTLPLAELRKLGLKKLGLSERDFGINARALEKSAVNATAPVVDALGRS